MGRGGDRHYVLANAHVPTGCIQGAPPAGAAVCVDNLAQLDIEASRRAVDPLGWHGGWLQ